MVHDLGPDGLHDDSVGQVLHQLADEIAWQSGVAVEVRTSGAVVPLPQHVATALLRTARGALANVVEHAGARRAVVTLSYLDDEVSLDVCDDGRGMPTAGRSRPNAGGGPRGLGRWAIRDRVETLGGRLVLESTAGSGTALAVTLPLRTGGGRPNDRGAGTTAAPA